MEELKDGQDVCGDETAVSSNMTKVEIVFDAQARSVRLGDGADCGERIKE